MKHISVQRCPVYLRLLWLGRISVRFALQISQSVQRCYFSVNLQVVRKDVLPYHHNNSLNYLFRWSYGWRYIGRANQWLDT